MSLQTTSVSQCLEKKLSIAGYEVPDLLAIFLTMSLLNFIFGWMGQRVLMVWLPTLTLAAALRWGKRGKPDNYLVHLLKFKMSPKLFSAFSDAKGYVIPPSIQSKGES